MGVGGPGRWPEGVRPPHERDDEIDHPDVAQAQDRCCSAQECVGLGVDKNPQDMAAAVVGVGLSNSSEQFTGAAACIVVQPELSCMLQRSNASLAILWER